VKQNTASQRVVSELRARIRSGSLAPGDRVPSARQITEEFDVALATAQKVLATLRREGLVRMVPGVGTIVRTRDSGPELSSRAIVEAAIAIADDEGLDALSMRGVATELGVATMSLYRHVTSKEDLVQRMADAVFAESPPPPRGSRPWRERLLALAQVQWAAYERHPWLPHVISISRPQLMPNGMRHTEELLVILDELPFDDATKLRTGVALLGVVRGLAAGLESERNAERDTGITSDEHLDTQEERFAELVPRFPVLERLGRVDVPMSLDVLFRVGLACFLDGIEAQVAAAG